MGMEARIQKFLEAVIGNREKHSLWLNTLSFLEYIGCRKIIKSQDANYMDFTLLSHTVEEARHSFFFRKLAKGSGLEDKASFSPEYLLGGKAAEIYFQCLDKGIEKQLKEEFTGKESLSNFLNYCYTSLFVELRAIHVYSVYEKLLRNTSHSFSLEGLLTEEKDHLEAIEKELQDRDPSYRERRKAFQGMEEKLFDKLWQSLEASL